MEYSLVATVHLSEAVHLRILALLEASEAAPERKGARTPPDVLEEAIRIGKAHGVAASNRYLKEQREKVARANGANAYKNRHALLLHLIECGLRAVEQGNRAQAKPT